jgi:hypothetical protein
MSGPEHYAAGDKIMAEIEERTGINSDVAGARAAVAFAHYVAADVALAAANVYGASWRGEGSASDAWWAALR